MLSPALPALRQWDSCVPVSRSCCPPALAQGLEFASLSLNHKKQVLLFLVDKFIPVLLAIMPQRSLTDVQFKRHPLVCILSPGLESLSHSDGRSPPVHVTPFSPLPCLILRASRSFTSSDSVTCWALALPWHPLSCPQAQRGCQPFLLAEQDCLLHLSQR